MQRIIRRIPSAGLGQAADSRRPGVASASTPGELVFASYISDGHRVLLFEGGRRAKSATDTTRETRA